MLVLKSPFNGEGGASGSVTRGKVACLLDDLENTNASRSAREDKNVVHIRHYSQLQLFSTQQLKARRLRVSTHKCLKNR